MKDEISGFYDDDGTKINPELILNPGLCVTCKEAKRILNVMHMNPNTEDSIHFTRYRKLK